METWTAPDFVEIKMDAEIGSYQDDFDPLREESPLFLEQAAEADAHTK
jgi:hypothetical protein